MLQFEDTKLLPMHQEMRTKFEMMESRFDSLRSEMNTRFTSLEKRLDATNFSIRLLACSYRWRNYRRCGSRILTDLREVEVGIK